MCVTESHAAMGTSESREDEKSGPHVYNVWLAVARVCVRAGGRFIETPPSAGKEGERCEPAAKPERVEKESERRS